MLAVLRRWWEKKYQIPSNHDLFTSRTEHDLLTEYYEDIFERNPLEKWRNEDGTIQFTDTGDSVIDYWEQLLAEGRDGEVDLLEGFTDEERASFAKFEKKAIEEYTFGATAKHAQSAVQKQILEQGTLPARGKTFGGNG